MNKQAKIYVAGHRGMVGSALLRCLDKQGYTQIITRKHDELDLCNQAAVQHFFQEERPDVVFLAAAKVGGILANNTYRADFIYQNLMIECNVIQAAKEAGVNDLLFLGSSCIYPRDCPQPIREDYLLSGALEPTNEPYAVAKIAGIKLCESYNQHYQTRYRYVMPTNLYGPNDNYDLNNSHVLPALIRKAHEAKSRGDNELMVWGTGQVRREFLYVDDLAEACLFVMNLDQDVGLLNIGTGEDCSIRELSELVMQVVGFNGSLIFDTSKPDGTPRKLLNVEKIRQLGWQATTSLVDGIAKAYADFLNK
jgi:GDP-L-fucose synthase